MGDIDKGNQPKPDHEAIEALLAADPNCEKDDSPDETSESTPSSYIPIEEMERRLEAHPRFEKMQPSDDEATTTFTFVDREAATRFKRQQEDDDG